jgi:hypothetical protein
MRKLSLKRFQLLSKCVDYKMATIYMQSSDWDIESVIPPIPHEPNKKVLFFFGVDMGRHCKNIMMIWNGRKLIRDEIQESRSTYQGDLTRQAWCTFGIWHV